jgi:hypothetical protein
MPPVAPRTKAVLLSIHYPRMCCDGKEFLAGTAIKQLTKM